MTTIETEMAWMKMVRSFTLETIHELSPEQLVTVPERFHNHVLWNVGHLLYEQYSLFYGSTHQPYPLPPGCQQQYKLWFSRGTGPLDWTEAPDTALVLEQFAASTDTIIADASAGRFAKFAPVELMQGLTLGSVAQCAAFHCVHEGIHLGTIGAMKKLVQ